MMRSWFKRRRHEQAERRRFADLQAMPVAERSAVLSGPDRTAWIEAAANYGLVEAQLLWGKSLLATDPALAFRWISGAAATSYPPAVNMLGRCLEKGWGTQPDTTAAAAHYQSAAEQGLDWAQYNLANLLLYGLGIPTDRGAAYRLYEQAAAQGHAKAMNMLGRCHEEGWDRPADLVQAVSWYRRAAAGGDYRGQFNLGTILAQSGAHREARAWFAAALASGDPEFRAEACARLGQSPDPADHALARAAMTPPRQDAAGD